MPFPEQGSFTNHFCHRVIAHKLRTSPLSPFLFALDLLAPLSSLLPLLNPLILFPSFCLLLSFTRSLSLPLFFSPLLSPCPISFGRRGGWKKLAQKLKVKPREIQKAGCETLHGHLEEQRARAHTPRHLLGRPRTGQKMPLKLKRKSCEGRHRPQSLFWRAERNGGVAV